jgi:hypothetical protein
MTDARVDGRLKEGVKTWTGLNWLCVQGKWRTAMSKAKGKKKLKKAGSETFPNQLSNYRLIKDFVHRDRPPTSVGRGGGGA